MKRSLFPLTVVACFINHVALQQVNGLAAPNPRHCGSESLQDGRRDFLVQYTATLMTVALGSPSHAVALDEDTVIDMAALNAARQRKSDVLASESVDLSKVQAARSAGGATSINNPIVSLQDPPPYLSIRGGPEGKSTLKIPRVGYSFYKTKPEQAERCTQLALQAGVKHFDMASSYGSDPEITKALQAYLTMGGVEGWSSEGENPAVVEGLRASYRDGEAHATTTGAAPASTLTPPPLGSAGRKGRRQSLFLSYKLSNDEQSTDATVVRRTVKAKIASLQCSYLDMVLIHSPLTDSDRRLSTYKALLDLRDSGFIKTVGVCNYGLGALQEIAKANLELPAVNQLELSPFHAHKDTVEWCSKYGIAVSCAAWSRLSGTDGPTEGWEVLSKIAAAKQMTKAQVLVRWALQKGYLCVPRSASASKLERLAIAENSYGGVNPSKTDVSFVLTQEEMSTLDNLDVSYKAGKLGRRDGWTDADVTGADWDPTEFV